MNNWALVFTLILLFPFFFFLNTFELTYAKALPDKIFKNANTYFHYKIVITLVERDNLLFPEMRIGHIYSPYFMEPRLNIISAIFTGVQTLSSNDDEK